jgi:4-alpha-glucanotransferase
MNKQVEIALAHPVFDPKRQITTKYDWWAERLVTAMLTCNIGME